MVAEPGAGHNIATGQHLAREEINPGGFRHHRHALVVRSKRTAHIHTKHGQLYPEKRQGEAPREEGEKYAEVPDDPNCDDDQLAIPPFYSRCDEQVLDRLVMQVEDRKSVV